MLIRSPVALVAHTVPFRETIREKKQNKTTFELKMGRLRLKPPEIHAQIKHWACEFGPIQ